MRRKNMGVEAEKQFYKKEYRLSEFNAKNGYDYTRIKNADNIFLKCNISVENEKVIITYNIDEKEEYKKILKESRIVRLKALLDVGRFRDYWEEFVFSIRPENLYYDMYDKVFVMFRDVRDTDYVYEKSSCLEEYKALIGCTLSAKYSFDDYLQGGMKLLKKDKFLVQIAEAEDWESVMNVLQTETERLIVYNREKRMEVNRSSYKFNKRMMIFSFFISGIFIIVCSYYALWIKPYDEGVIQANHCYLDMNYTEVIDSLGKIKLSRLDNYEKYILAISYIKCENLTDEQKTNILAAVEIHGNEKILDYWIQIGRMNVKDAENIAQQISDNQLLVYAYLKERYILEADTALSGEEKTAQLKDLDDKIKTLTEQENTEE